MVQAQRLNSVLAPGADARQEIYGPLLSTGAELYRQPGSGQLHQ